MIIMDSEQTAQNQNMDYAIDYANNLANYIRKSIAADPNRNADDYTVRIGTDADGADTVAYPSVGVFKRSQGEPFVVFQGTDAVREPGHQDDDFHFDILVAQADQDMSSGSAVLYGLYHDYETSNLYFDFHDACDAYIYDPDSQYFFKDMIALSEYGPRINFVDKSEIDEYTQTTMDDYWDRFAVMSQVRDDFIRLSDKYGNLQIDPDSEIGTKMGPDFLQVVDSDTKAIYKIKYEVYPELYRSDGLWQAKIASASVDYGQGEISDPEIVMDSDFGNKIQAANILSSVGSESYEISLDDKTLQERSKDFSIEGFDVYDGFAGETDNVSDSPNKDYSVAD